MARRFPQPWWVNVRVHIADSEDGRHRNGWYQHAFRFRNRRDAELEYERRCEQSLEDLLDDVTTAVFRRGFVSSRPPVAAVVEWGSRYTRASTMREAVRVEGSFGTTVDVETYDASRLGIAS